jgi:NitT/TauT family transport system substrate-binding protein
MDRGFGSGDVPVKISSGAYDVGVADLNPTIRMRLERPDVDMFSPLIIYDATALAVMTLRRENIRTPKDLEGKTIASPESDAGRQLFPAFAKGAGINAASVRWQTVTPQLREPMLAQGRANAITGFITSGIFSLRGLGVAEQDIVTMLFSDVGADFYSTSMITTRRWAQANPRAIRQPGRHRGRHRGPAPARAADRCRAGDGTAPHVAGTPDLHPACPPERLRPCGHDASTTIC